MSARTRLEDIHRRIRDAALSAGREPASVRLVAVSKMQPASAVRELYELGQRDFGENYAQELLEKADELDRMGCTDIRWHFIGHLQTNKAKLILPRVACVHTVDSEKIARELARNAAGRRLPVFIEINISSEESKSGAAPAAAMPLAHVVAGMPELALQGLMCVPSARETGDELRARFADLRALEKDCRPMSAGRLSMGMTLDFELAIAEGATDVRLGTALFGPRR